MLLLLFLLSHFFVGGARLWQLGGAFLFLGLLLLLLLFYNYVVIMVVVVAALDGTGDELTWAWLGW